MSYKESKEECVTVIFNGYSVDLFKTETGDLGITVTEQFSLWNRGFRVEQNEEDLRAVDIFVSPDAKTVTHTAWSTD